MFGSNSTSSAPPPEVPAEFADTYRVAYEQALADFGETPGRIPAPPVAVPSQRRTEDSPGVQLDSAPGQGPTFAPTPTDVQGARISGPLFADDDPIRPGFWGQLKSSPLFAPVLVGLVVFVLILSAYLIGLAGASGDDQAAVANSSQQVTPYDGQVSWQHDLGARGTCGNGRQVGRNRPDRAVDGRTATAWVCRGRAQGMTLTVRLPKSARIGQIGLIPGQVGSGRGAVSRDIRQVRWTIGTESFVQEIDGTSADRSVRDQRIPLTRARTVKLEILQTSGRPRGQTAVSEVVIGTAD